MTRKITGNEELRRVADALDQSVLDASSEQLREELSSEGLEEAKVIAEMDAMLAEAKRVCGKLRLEQARGAVTSYRSQASNVSSIDRDRIRKKMNAMRSGAGEDVGGMMMAARKGKKLSDRDEEGALDDLAQLESLDKDADESE